MNVEQANDILLDSIQRWDPVRVFACFSGGHDSLVSTHLTMSLRDRIDVPTTVLHINTRIGIEETRQFVRDTCARRDWPLWERYCAAGEYERIVLEHGFPGPSVHPRMYQRLKERVVYAACKEAKVGHARRAKVLFVTGIRADESRRRAGYKRVESKVRAQIWINPIYHFSGFDIPRYMETHGLPENPIRLRLGMSGECLCGAFAKKGERHLIETLSPATGARLRALEEKVRAAGMPWGWEDPGPPKRWRMEREGQLSLFRPLCAGCEKMN
jgi:3'-phosphoadenosine 5'-phosphosulfate sulfotransferase (PAPS reductase)/FAD synthetase